MPVKIRLTRHGKKDQAYYHVVVADGRAPRDGKFIERLGTYIPNTNPATIDIDFEKTLAWIQKGAQPTDTARTLLSHKGVMFKDHLLRGVAKKALTQEQAEAKFAKWLADKATKVESKKENAVSSKKSVAKQRIDAEAKAKEARAAKIAAKQAAAVATPEAPAAEAPATEEAPQA